MRILSREQIIRYFHVSTNVTCAQRTRDTCIPSRDLNIKSASPISLCADLLLCRDASSTVCENKICNLQCGIADLIKQQYLTFNILINSVHKI